MNEQEVIKRLSEMKTTMVMADSIEALTMAAVALEKQIPAKPITINEDEFCPKCKRQVEPINCFCCNCGQRLEV